jgi:hypothetical protein
MTGLRIRRGHVVDDLRQHAARLERHADAIDVRASPGPPAPDPR